jgi:hypothetical protein
VDKPGFGRLAGEDISRRVTAQYDAYLVDSTNHEVYYHVHWEYIRVKETDEWEAPLYANITGEQVSKLPAWARSNTDPSKFLVGYTDPDLADEHGVTLPNPYPTENRP